MFGGGNTAFGRQSTQFSGGMNTLGQSNSGGFSGNTGGAFGGGGFGAGGGGILRSSPNQGAGSAFGGGNSGGFGGGFQSQNQSFGSPQTGNTGFGNTTGGAFGANRNNLSINTQQPVGFGGSQMGGGTGFGMSNTGTFGNQNKLGGTSGMGQGMGTSGFGMNNNMGNTMNNTMGGGGFGTPMNNTFGNQSSPGMGVNQPAPIGTSQYNPQNPLTVKDKVNHPTNKGKQTQVDNPFYHVCGSVQNNYTGYASKSQEELRWEDVQMKNGVMNPPQYGNTQQSGGLGGVMGLGNTSKPGGFGNTGFGQTTTNQQSPFGATNNTGLGLNAQQPTATTGFGGFGSNAGGFGAGAPQSGGFAASGFGANAQANTQASPFGGGATNTGFGGIGQTSNTTGAFGSFGANNNAKPTGFGQLGATNTQTTSPGFGTGAATGFGTGGAAAGFGTGTATSFGPAGANKTFGAASGTPGGFGATAPSHFGAAATPGTSGGFGAAPAGNFAGFGNAAPAAGGFGLGATSQPGALGAFGTAKPAPFGSPAASAPAFNFNPGGAASNQSAAPNTGAFGNIGAFNLGAGTLGSSTGALGGFNAGGALGSTVNAIGANPMQQQQIQQQQQQLNLQQQQQFVNPMISIKDKVTSLRSKAKKLSDTQSKDIPSTALVTSKYNDLHAGGSLRGGLPMPMGSNARMTPRGKQATTPLSNQKTLSSSMMSNVTKASSTFTSPDAFMGRSVRRLVIDSSSISAGNDSWVNKLLPQRVGTPSDRPETEDLPEPWNNRTNGDERDINNPPGSGEPWSDMKYQEEAYDSRSNSPEQRFQPSPEAMRGGSGIIGGSATKNINNVNNDKDNNDSNSVGKKKNNYDDTEINPNAPKLTNRNYKLTPSLDVLKMMTDDELSCVRNFTIARRDETDHNSLVAEIEWLDEVDLRGVNLDDIVQMSHMEVAIYEDSSYKPLHGEELNKPCKVTFYRVLPKKNQSTEQALKKWKKAIEKDGAKIISYDEFSKYDIDGPPIGRLVFQTIKWC